MIGTMDLEKKENYNRKFLLMVRGGGRNPVMKSVHRNQLFQTYKQLSQ